MLSLDNLPTKERSLLAALEVVRADGFSELTTRAIARRSGLTQPAIYRHFSNKEELASRVLGEIRRLFYARLERGAAGEDPRARLMATMAAFCDFAVEEPRLYEALFFQTAGGGPQLPPVDRGKGGSIFSFLVERTTECVETGLFVKCGPVVAALTLAAHTQGLVLLHRQGRFGSRDRFAEFFARSVGVVVEGLGD